MKNRTFDITTLSTLSIEQLQEISEHLQQIEAERMSVKREQDLNTVKELITEHGFTAWELRKSLNSSKSKKKIKITDSDNQGNYVTLRPICEIAGCSSYAHNTGNKRKDGSIIYRRRAEVGYLCVKHHYELTAEKTGMSVTEWLNSNHPYKKYNKGFCENKNGKLGFKCSKNTNLLDVHHLNGDHDDNRPENLQTLCRSCHTRSHKTKN